MRLGHLPHPAPLSEASYSAVELSPDGDRIWMLDQRRLPAEEEYHELWTAGDVARAIGQMVVRGAPAIGISAAYAMVLAARANDQLEQVGSALKAARPTAVNLAWAVDRMLGKARSTPPADIVGALTSLAREMHRDDVKACKTMGRIGAERIADGATVLTHCNTGGLATGGYGTALGVIRTAHEQDKKIRVLADETRPYLQGARLTAWELAKLGIPVEVIADAAAGYFFSKRQVDVAIVGADRIAKNGDVANKIGTYSVACLAKAHDTPFYVAAPWSTVDEACASGADIVIEERGEEEVTHVGSVKLTPVGVHAKNPAFDVTPARLVQAIFTERGAIEPVGAAALRSVGEKAREP